MKLRGIEFGPVLGASGVQGFFSGDEYRYRAYYKFIPGFSFKGMTFVAKTTTLLENEGNMQRRKDGITPRDFKPECIKVNFRKGYALNAVGLSGPGARFLFDTGKWQARDEPFMLSFMSVKKERAERLEELRMFVDLFGQYKDTFSAPVALQQNFSCPNVDVHSDDLYTEIHDALDIASSLQIPLVPKINILADPSRIGKVAMHPECDAICVSNTLPWSTKPDKMAWKELFGTDESPLKKFGTGGGLSGAPLLPLLIDWLERARGLISVPIIAGGGIMSADDVQTLSYAHPAAVSLGTIAMLRPWRVQSAIKMAYKVIR